MIYHYLLTTPNPINNLQSHLGNSETVMLDQHIPIPDLDAMILRTCRLIYSEALPILYGYNVFQFDSPSSVRCFQNRNLGGYPIGIRALVLLFPTNQVKTKHC